jgi:penicillin-binding protein 1A
VIALAAAAALAIQAPEIPRLPPIQREPQITYLDRTGAVIGVRGGLYGPAVDVAKLPPYVGGAVVAIEDRRFYEHEGFDPRGMARALVVALEKGRATQGASTITQQTARLLFLNQDRSLERKATELVYAVQLEQTYSKKQILGMYISRANFGSGAYGLEAAARRYFNKPASKLTIKEAAMLAGVLKSPTNYNPAAEPEACEERSRLVLDAMAETGVITAAQRDKAKAEKPKVWKTSPNGPAQYFIDWIDPQVRSLTGPLKRDLIVDTTLDQRMEIAASDAARATVTRFKPQLAEQAAVVGIDGAGRVRTLVGGLDYASAPYNRAVSARRQAGSAWKPFVYLTALESGLTPESPVTDEPVTIAGWSPRNYEDGFLGPITLERALAQSVNTVAARLADQVGRPNVATVAHRLGIVSQVNTDPAMALGTTLVSPLEMTEAYAVFSNGGNKVSPYGIERIRSGATVIYQHKSAGWTPIVGNPALSDLNRMLRQVIASGTGARAAIPNYDLAGKTGTTSDYRDAWFCGYSGGFAACAWMGRDDNQPMRRITGGIAPVEIWKSYMTVALKRIPPVAIPAGQLPPPPPPPVDEPDDEPIVAQAPAATGVASAAPN